MVQKALSSIKSTTAPGHDKFPGFVLKRLAGALAPNITTIYNSSIHNNIVPNSWKMAEVKAIYKQKGSKSDPDNYRPISVLPILGRTLEKLVATQLYAYCDTHNILPLEQFGFRRHSSCEMALFAATDSWMKSVDRGSFAGALLVDLSKAFDTVPHQLLLSELRDIGCSIEVLLWFCDYLTHRLQRVITYEEITDWIMVSRGFPQGSGLSPLLFSIFVRNLPRLCSSPIFQFADDTTVVAEDPSLSVVADKLKSAFDDVKQFCDSHELKINLEKTQLILFKKPGKSIPEDFHIILENCTVTPQKTVKLLGVTLDQHLTFGPHIENVANKCQGLLGILAKATPYLPKELLKLMYTALIRSHIILFHLFFDLLISSQNTSQET